MNITASLRMVFGVGALVVGAACSPPASGPDAPVADDGRRPEHDAGEVVADDAGADEDGGVDDAGVLDAGVEPPLPACFGDDATVQHPVGPGDVGIVAVEPVPGGVAAFGLRDTYDGGAGPMSRYQWVAALLGADGGLADGGWIALTDGAGLLGSNSAIVARDDGGFVLGWMDHEQQIDGGLVGVHLMPVSDSLVPAPDAGAVWRERIAGATFELVRNEADQEWSAWWSEYEASLAYADARVRMARARINRSQPPQMSPPVDVVVTPRVFLTDVEWGADRYLLATRVAQSAESPEREQAIEVSREGIVNPASEVDLPLGPKPVFRKSDLAWSGSEWGLASTRGTNVVSDDVIIFRRIAPGAGIVGGSERYLASDGNNRDPLVGWGDGTWQVAWNRFHAGPGFHPWYARIDAEGDLMCGQSVRTGNDSASMRAFNLSGGVLRFLVVRGKPGATHGEDWLITVP